MSELKLKDLLEIMDEATVTSRKMGGTQRTDAFKWAKDVFPPRPRRVEEWEEFARELERENAEWRECATIFYKRWMVWDYGSAGPVDLAPFTRAAAMFQKLEEARR